MTTELTEQQSAAIFLQNSSIALAAGAGCGKTFVLTRRFLSQLDPGQDASRLQSIVAITFTEKAAREMRDRVRHACHQRLEQCTPDEVESWLKIVRALDSARISTIHAFCASLLRSHAVELGLDPGFGLIEDALGNQFLKRCVSEAVNNLLSQEDADCMEFVKCYGLERTHSTLGKLLVGRLTAENDAFLESDEETVGENWQKQWNEEHVPGVLKHFQSSRTVQNLLELLERHEPHHEVMQQRRATLQDGLQNLCAATTPLESLESLEDVLSAARVQGSGIKKAWDSAEIYERHKTQLETFRKELKKIYPAKLVIAPEHFQEAAHIACIAARLVRNVGEHYERQKRTSGLLDFEDLLVKAHRLLADHPEARQSAASNIDFLMVDEFQDTDPTQAQIVRLLCGDELATGKLFLVGDIKQSIYRFRRADPKVFTELQQEIPEQGRLPLSVNFRSQPAILDFVNGLLHDRMGESYEPLRPHHSQLSPVPCIEFLFAQPAIDEEVDRSVEDRRKREADWIARRIVQLLEDETPRIRVEDATGKSSLRPVQAGDIAILFRAFSNIALYEEALRKYGIDYYLVGGKAFFSQQEVYDITNLCRFLDDPGNELSLAGILRSPMFGLSDDVLFVLIDEFVTLRSALRAKSWKRGLTEEQVEQVQFASQVLRELADLKDRVALVDLLNHAIARTGYDALLLCEHLGKRKLANLRKLLDMAEQFDRSGMYSLGEFVQRLHDSVLEDTAESLAATALESADVVQLMTIHKSKGLEFPLVVLADINRTDGGDRSLTVYDPELGPLFELPKKGDDEKKHPALLMHKEAARVEDEAESLRLLYVAMTRAADHLILSGNLQENYRSPWVQLLEEKFDLGTGLPKHDPLLGTVLLGDISPERIPDILPHRQRPEIDSKKRIGGKRQIPLEKFREHLETTEPVPLPKTFGAISASFDENAIFSVTEIQNGVNAMKETTDKEYPKEKSALSAADRQTLGTLVHRVLEEIDFVTGDAVEKSVSQIATEFHLDEESDLIGEVKKRVQQFLKSASYEELQKAKSSFRELDFLYRHQNDKIGNAVTFSGQIDCLYETAQGHWKLVDYKVSSADSFNPEKYLSQYEVQLAIYAKAVRQTFETDLRFVELIVLHDELHRLPFDFSSQNLSHIFQKVDEYLEVLCVESVSV